MFSDSPRSSKKNRSVPSWLIVVAVILFAAAYFGDSHFVFRPTQGDVIDVRLVPGYFIGIAQLLVVGAIGYFFGRMRAVDDLTSDDDKQPELKDRLRAIAKSDKGSKICGVCAGLGEHTPVPAWIWRVVFIFFALANGFGLLVYVILAFAMPAEGEAPAAPTKTPDSPGPDIDAPLS